ncbi:hypothetical protein GQ651_07060 [Alphaproteobacteria bacterium GH1-50]|uniref:Uncharacterized protein n=1 Tax=Kangsaoukella pontilimi TaxID=2691042 RepID=A0A7C9IHE0_9RHOB|nr:Tad domain-containing protein [Kangsaoukella pontilimi]MXQ07602.1 hypothetical protein [Kangsaoukella pontilimi]
MQNATLRKFTHREDGSLTVLGLFMIVTFLIIGGLGLDVMSALSTRTKLQVAADAAAHAALMARSLEMSEDDSKDLGMAMVYAALPQSKYGNLIEKGDIQFGKWDSSTQLFTVLAGSDDAVLVNTQQIAARKNPLGTFFLRVINMNSMDVISQSVFETYVPTCFREGFVAQDVVDVQSNNNYDSGFCIHSNTHVEVNNGNSFCGAIVSMPDERDLVVPNSDESSNPCLTQASRDGAYRLKVFQQIDEIINNVTDPTSKFFRTAYVDINPLSGAPTVVPVAKNDKLHDVWVSGAIHTRTCNASNQTLSLQANQTLTKGVIVTNCQVSLGAGSQLIDVIIVSTNENADSINGAAGVVLGLDDNCTPGGGAQLVTKGGVKFPADLQIYGGQIIAAKDILFESRANGIEGVSMVAGGRIDGTSLMNMGFCGGAGMENNFAPEYHRMAT